MSLPQPLVGAIYSAITNAPANDNAIREAMDAIYTETCLDLFESTLSNPDNDALGNDELKALVDPIFEQVAEDMNELLIPYKITLGKWTCNTLAKRVEAMNGGTYD